MFSLLFVRGFFFCKCTHIGNWFTRIFYIGCMGYYYIIILYIIHIILYISSRRQSYKTKNNEKNRESKLNPFSPNSPKIGFIIRFSHFRFIFFLFNFHFESTKSKARKRVVHPCKRHTWKPYLASCHQLRRLSIYTLPAA